MDDLNRLDLDPLSLSEERKLAREKQKRGLTARKRDAIHQRLVMTNMKGAVDYMRRVSRGRRRKDELVSLAYAALMLAVKNFRDRGHAFLHYARQYLRGAVLREWGFERVVKNTSFTAETEFSEEVIPHSHLLKFFEEPDIDEISARVNKPLLLSLLKRLKPYERQVFRLHYWEHFSFKEIGDQMGIGRSAVQATHTRALLKLRRFVLRKKIT